MNKSVSDAMEMVSIPRAEYERLRTLAEDHADIVEADQALAALRRGEDVALPGEFARRLFDGESPLKVFREFRGLSGSALAERSGVNRVQILDIEAGRSVGSVATLAKLARALDVTIDDLVPDTAAS
ncbi:helix-turn-helix transcriptional regulator [Acuticoccus sp. I52.16.1]|uniref:helix-turn-helix transcriptional regulator n=1 Tax=Acuticoccus sp. I52.16.1 TaxID=2928472 RepID=UPI001FD362C6|nr:helix-turn-helix transcriptional regulator [Acuticoccus sp. I52.16.1]UOM37176.1 helix-turn-helix transcriptional regulator [Acuticoccus sp. I52.16.1]